MTEKNYDDRAAVYVAAREKLKLADEIKAQAPGELPAVLPDEYWAAIAEAAVYSNLARADAAVGFLTGSYFAEEGRRDEKARAKNEAAEMLAKIESRGAKRKKDREEVHARLQAQAKHAELLDDEPPTWPAPPKVEQLLRVTNDGPIRVIITAAGDYKHRTGTILENRLSSQEAPRYLVALDADHRPAQHHWFTRDELDLVIG